jgi:hypothetical protein
MTSSTIATPDATTTTLPEATVEAFRRRLRGPLLVPRDEGFEAATRLWNGMIAKTPALVVTAAGTADVVAAVAFARDHGLSLSVRGGGHNIAGTALADGGLTIDLSRLRGIVVDPGRRPRRCHLVHLPPAPGRAHRPRRAHRLAVRAGRGDPARLPDHHQPGAQGAGGVDDPAQRPAGAVRARGLARPADLRHGPLLQRRPRPRRRGPGTDPGAGRPRRGPAGGAAPVKARTASVRCDSKPCRGMANTLTKVVGQRGCRRASRKQVTRPIRNREAPVTEVT